MLPESTIRITQHAVTRWRERAAIYGDESQDEVAAAFASARVLTRGETPRWIRLDALEHCRFLDGPNPVWFIAREIDGGHLVVTVRDNKGDASRPSYSTRTADPTTADGWDRFLADLRNEVGRLESQARREPRNSPKRATLANVHRNRKAQLEAACRRYRVWLRENCTRVLVGSRSEPSGGAVESD